MNLFFSSLAMRTASAKPIPEEQPVMRTTFWFIAAQQKFSFVPNAEKKMQRSPQDKVEENVHSQPPRWTEPTVGFPTNLSSSVSAKRQLRIYTPDYPSTSQTPAHAIP